MAASVSASAERVSLLLLHGAPEAAGSNSAFDWRFAAASVLVVGSVGALLYWYYGRRTAAA